MPRGTDQTHQTYSTHQTRQTDQTYQTHPTYQTYQTDPTNQTPPTYQTHPTLLDLKLRQLRGDVTTCRRRLHALIDVNNRPVTPHIERPSRRQADHAEHAIRPRRFLCWIRKDRIIGADLLGKLLAGLGIVYADGEVGDVEGANRIAALTERLAFRGSSAGERFREPRQDDVAFAFEVSERVDPAVGPLQAERRRGISDVQLHGLLRASEPTRGHTECD
jgi:hypothetical protein